MLPSVGAVARATTYGAASEPTARASRPPAATISFAHHGEMKKPESDGSGALPLARNGLRPGAVDNMNGTRARHPVPGVSVVGKVADGVAAEHWERTPFGAIEDFGKTFAVSSQAELFATLYASPLGKPATPSVSSRPNP